MDNSLLAVRGINHKYIVVVGIKNKEILFICIILAEMNIMLALLGCMCSRKEILFMSSMVKLNNKFLRFILHFNLNKLIKL